MPEWLLSRIEIRPIRSLVENYLDGFAHRYIYLGRLVTILFSLLLAGLVFLWAQELYGHRAGLFALTLYAFSPNILAHSRLVTADLYAATLMFLAVYSFWRYLISPSNSGLLASAITLGLAQLTKYTAVHLVPIFLLLLVVSKWRILAAVLKRASGQSVLREGLRFSAITLIYLVIVLTVINAGFLFEGTFTLYRDYPLQSGLFRALKPVLDNLPVPVPFAYLHGLDWIRHNDETGTTIGNLYLLGQLQTTNKDGWWYYFPVAFLLKSTLGFLGLLAVGLYTIRRRSMGLRSNEMFLLIPALYLFLFFSLFFNTQIGLRFLLPIYPLLFVFVGGLVKLPGRGWGGLTVFLLLAHIASSVSYHPHYLSYFNELIGDRKNMYKYLADSNVDWGQNENYLEGYLEQQKDMAIKRRPKIGPWTPYLEMTSGRLIVAVNALVGIYESEDFSFLRESFEPAGHIAYSFLIYDLPHGLSGGQEVLGSP